VDGLSQAEDIGQVRVITRSLVHQRVTIIARIIMESLRNDLSTKLARNGYDDHCLVSSISVSDAISKLKSGKGDGNT